MAAALLRRRLGPAGASVSIASAGLLTRDRPASAEAVEVMGEYGLDISAHRSQLLRPDLLAGADLVVGMARQHVREASVLDPAAWPKTFTLKDLVRRAGTSGPRVPGQPFGDWLAGLSQGRVIEDVLTDDPDDEVSDPIGQPVETYREVAAELDGLLEALVAAAWPPGVLALGAA